MDFSLARKLALDPNVQLRFDRRPLLLLVNKSEEDLLNFLFCNVRTITSSTKDTLPPTHLMIKPPDPVTYMEKLC